MPVPSQRLASTASFLLNSANIPNILFGWLALALVSHDTRSREVDLVVPDTHIKAAIQTLTDAGYGYGYPCNGPCTRPDCIYSWIDRSPSSGPDDDGDGDRDGDKDDGARRVPFHLRWHQPAEAHFHLDGGLYVLSVHRKSQVLWWLRDEEMGESTEELLATSTAAAAAAAANGNGNVKKNQHVILSNDITQIPPTAVTNGSGAWTSLSPVRILNPHSFTDAVLLLLCRNFGHPQRLYKLWANMISVLMDDEPGALRKEVREEFRDVWEALNGRVERKDGVDSMAALYRISRDFGRRGLLGPGMEPVEDL